MFDSERAFSRNLGFLSDVEQNRLHESVVAVAGAGGDGGLLAIELARLGVGEIRLADPEMFEVENINRQATARMSVLGVNKAESVAEYISDINPSMTVSVFSDGVTPDNVGDFTAGVDLIVDETEFTMPEIGTLLARQARKIGKPVLMALNVGFGGIVTSYRPTGKTFEEFMGLDPDAPLDEIAAAEIPLSKWVPYIPSYADIDVFKAVAEGKKSAPTVVQGVGIAASTAATQALLHLAPSEKRPQPVFAKQVISIDPYEIRAKIIRNPKLSFYTSLAKVVLNNKLKRTPKASY